MLVVLKEPIIGPDMNVLAVNLETFNAIAILNLENQFQLVVLKYFDGHQSNQSNMHCILDTFGTYEECLGFFQELLDALKSGEVIFDLRPRLSPGDKKARKQTGIL